MASALHYNQALALVEGETDYTDWRSAMQSAGIKDMVGILNLARQNGDLTFQNVRGDDGKLKTVITRASGGEA